MKTYRGQTHFPVREHASVLAVNARRVRYEQESGAIPLATYLMSIGVKTQTEIDMRTAHAKGVQRATPSAWAEIFSDF